MCMRVSDGAAAHRDLGHGIGHIHELCGGIRPSPSPSMPAAAPSPRFGLAFNEIWERWRSTTTDSMLAAFADELGVSAESLRRLDAVFAGDRGVWAFPMHDDRRQIIGFRLRSEDSQKFALSGSRSGAFIPSGLDSRSTLLICEGPTDTAAALTLGFHAIGRPSCSGGTAIICDMIDAGRRRDLVIVADPDGPGRVGAGQLADRVLGICKSVRVITASPHKDLRAWLAAGATNESVSLRIEQALYHREQREC